MPLHLQPVLFAPRQVRRPATTPVRQSVSARGAGNRLAATPGSLGRWLESGRYPDCCPGLTPLKGRHGFSYHHRLLLLLFSPQTHALDLHQFLAPYVPTGVIFFPRASIY